MAIDESGRKGMLSARSYELIGRIAAASASIEDSLSLAITRQFGEMQKNAFTLIENQQGANLRKLFLEFFKTDPEAREILKRIDGLMTRRNKVIHSTVAFTFGPGAHGLTLTPRGAPWAPGEKVPTEAELERLEQDMHDVAVSLYAKYVEPDWD